MHICTYACECVPHSCLSWCTALSLRLPLHHSHPRCVPEQVALQQPDHDAAWGRVPGPLVACRSVSSGMWLVSCPVGVCGCSHVCYLDSILTAAIDYFFTPSQFRLQQFLDVLPVRPCHIASSTWIQHMQHLAFLLSPGTTLVCQCQHVECALVEAVR